MTIEEAKEFAKLTLNMNEDSPNSRTYEFAQLALELLEREDAMQQMRHELETITPRATIRTGKLSCDTELMVSLKDRRTEMRRKLREMPFDKMFEVDGNNELCHATGYEVCNGDTSKAENWWNEYVDSNDDMHYGR